MAKETKKPETQIITLDQVDINKLPEVQGWKEKLQKIDKDNPVITEIKNHKTYEKAKKHRYNRRQGRYDVQNSDKLIASTLSDLRKQSGTLHSEIIDIVKPGEDEQDKVIKAYEAKKEEERLEKERLEKERKDKIRNEVNQFYSTWKNTISEMGFSDIESTKKEIVLQLDEKDKKDFEDLQEDFNEKVKLLRDQFQERSAYLEQAEKDRIAREKLAAEKAELERKQKAKEEQDQKRNNEMRPYIVFIRDYSKMLNLDEEAYQKELAEIKKGAEFHWAEEAKKKKEMEEEAEKLRKEREELEAEKKRIVDTKAKEEAKKEVAQPEPVKEKEVIEPEEVKAEEPEEELSAWELPEETPKEITDKIEALAWRIRNDWTDPRGEVRRIVDLCEKLRQKL